MKILDKETNEVYETGGTYISVLIKDEDKDEWHTMDFISIKDLTDTLEDYEEPKKGFKKFLTLNRGFCVVFYDEETAEKEFEKAKAWKRLKAKGFFFDGRTSVHDNTVKIRARVGIPFLTDEFDELANDLDLLFGGEE